MNENKSSLIIATAIIIAGALIASAVIYTDQNKQVVVAENNLDTTGTPQQEQPSVDNLTPVAESDHVRGDRNAPVMIVSYSDFECPFCKRFHNTMLQIMDEYGASGQVAWVFRHFPLEALHPVKARQAALATECAATLGGNDVFWQYVDRMSELSLANNRTDVPAVVAQINEELGIDDAAHTACMESSEADAAVQTDLENAIASGGKGTPWSILVGPDGAKYTINGAQPYESIKQLIELALN